MTHTHNRSGLLIVFEGIDGTGKSTQLSLLANFLRRKGLPVIETREPTNGLYGKKIRALYTDRTAVSREEELELFLADRREHVDTLINPALRSGKIVLCDRYYLSTVAYQGAVGFSPAEILKKNSFAPEPDLALLFCAPPQATIARITGKRGDTLNDFEQEASLLRVAELFNSLQLPCIHRIDATPSIEAIHASVVNAILPLLPENQS